MATADRGQEPGLRQQVDDLESVLLGDVEPLGDVGHLDQPGFGLRAIDQDADGVARGFVEAHAIPVSQAQG